MNQQFQSLCLALSVATVSTLAAELSTNAPAATKPPAIPPKPPSPWQSTASVTASVSRGNADTLLMGAALTSLRKWDKNEIALGADATYGSNSDPTTRKETTTAQNYGLHAQYNRTLTTDRIYLGLLSEARQDRIASVDYRATVAPAFGYYAITNGSVKLKLENGPAFVFERLRGSGTANYLTLRLFEEVQWKIYDATIIQNMEYLPQVADFGNFVINFNLVLSTKISEKASANITFQDFYRSVPAPGRRSNDLRLMAGISYSF